MAARNPASVLPEPVGAQTSACLPATIAGQPPACASVGPSGNRRSNHTRTAGWNRSRIPGTPETANVDGGELTDTSASQPRWDGDACTRPRRRVRPAQPGSVQAWLTPPVQVQMTCWVPLTVVPPGSSRHFPDPLPTSDELDPRVHCWLVPPLQVQSWTRVPLAVPRPVTSRHLPLIAKVRVVPAAVTVQCWAGSAASQPSITAGVALAEPLFRAARHLPATPETISGEAADPGVIVRLSNWLVRE